MDILELHNALKEQRDNEENVWAVRDIKAGNTVFFKTTQALVEFFGILENKK